MRRLLPSALLVAAACACAPAAWAQHAPRITRAPEVGAELRLSDDVVTFAGIYQWRVGTRTDARLGFGIADPDPGDADAFLVGGLRSLLSRRSAHFPLDVALDGELDLFLGDDTGLALLVGPSFGAPAGAAGVFVPYVQPLLVVTSDGDTDADFGVRLGADYGLTPKLDLRGDVTIDGDTELRVALYFRI
jgi:hypothetical protein